MKHIKDWNWKQIGWRVLQALIIAIANSALWFRIFANLAPYNFEDGNKASVWDVLTVKYFTKEYDLTGFYSYNWYNSAIVYLVIIVFILLTLWWIWWLYKNKKEKQKIEKEDKFNKNIEKILGGKK